MSIGPPKSVSGHVPPVTADVPLEADELARIGSAFTARAAATPTELPPVLTRLLQHDPALVETIAHRDQRFIDYVRAHAAKTHSR